MHESAPIDTGSTEPAESSPFPPQEYTDEYNYEDEQRQEIAATTDSSRDRIYTITSLGEPSPDAEPAVWMGNADTEGLPPVSDSSETHTQSDTNRQENDAYYWENWHEGEARELGAMVLGRTTVTSSAEKSGTRQELPTKQQMVEGVTNDLIADMDAPLTSDQTAGIGARLRVMLKDLPGGESELDRLKMFLADPSVLAAEQPVSFFAQEKRWIAEAQASVFKLLGGLPSDVQDSETFQSLTRFYYYNPASDRLKDSEPWNVHNTIYSIQGQRRMKEMKQLLIPA